MTTPKMTKAHKQRIRKALVIFLGKGKDHATTSQTLQKQYNIGRRTLQRIIRDLIRDGHPIASVVKGGSKGYFITTNDAEFEEYRAQLSSRVRHDHERLA
ncbi:MAG: HTH domain-containing protein, partial [bacterium]|nr:HTH domain-containing protein [bacterium]